MRARLASGAPRISRWPNLEILVPRPLARRVATPRESSLTVLPRASPRRRSRRAATKHHRNTILRPLVEDEADTAPIGALPARLSHLHGPVGLPAASPPGARSGGITATPPRPEFAPSTPANRSTLRGASGTLLMGPWNGAFARADDSADPKPDARGGDPTPSLAWTTTRENTSPTSSSPARTRPPSTTRASPSKRCSRTRSPAASSSRRTSTTANRAGRQPARKSARIIQSARHPRPPGRVARLPRRSVHRDGARTAPPRRRAVASARCGCRLGEGRPPRRNARISRGWRTRGGKSEAEADEGVRRAVGARSSGWRRPRGTTDRGIPRARGSRDRAPGAEARCERMRMRRKGRRRGVRTRARSRRFRETNSRRLRSTVYTFRLAEHRR